MSRPDDRAPAEADPLAAPSTGLGPDRDEPDVPPRKRPRIRSRVAGVKPTAQ